MKMIFTFVLASALVMSTVLGRSSGPTPIQMTYEKDHKTVMQSEETAQIMAIDDRSSTLKFVMAIKSSSIWAEIQKRSLTISTPQGLDETVDEKSLNNLSDQELAQLKQACNDGLKCVAVDHLLVLKQVKSSLGDGKVSVRTAITKITQVLTQYTTEYHEDVYQYEAVSDSDDESAVYKSVTTIVEDNKELCRINLTPATVESQPKNYEDNAVPPLVVNKNNTVNYNTTKNYNINNGTVNSATITKEPSDNFTVVESSEPGTQTNSSDPRLVVVISPITKTTDDDEQTENQSLDDDVPKTKAPGNDNEYNTARYNHARDSRTSGRSYEPVATTDDQYARSADDNRAPAGYPNREENNIVSLQNGVENGQNAGETDSNNDMVSAGSDNLGIVRKGFVEDGTLNNGDMVQYNINNGTINEGTISDSNAKNGIINVGTVNNGPVNYGTADTYTNNGKQITMDNYKAQQYLSNIDKIYSAILERLG
ncbi:hypothetical protein ACI65C_010950 [Semiaphis heraclei]